MIIEQCYGKRAKKKEAKRRIDIISGNIASYSRVLNSEAQLKKIREFNEVAASIAMLNAEKDEKKKKRDEEKKQTDTEKEAKKTKRIAGEAGKREELLPDLTADVGKGYDFVKTLKNARLKDIIRFYFSESTTGIDNT